jgi:hypothetical protein
VKEGAVSRQQSLSSCAQEVEQAAREALPVVETILSSLTAAARLG